LLASWLSSEENTSVEDQVDQVKANIMLSNELSDDEIDCNVKLSKPRKKQVIALCKTARQMGYDDLLSIPYGGKKAIEVECLKNPKLFTPSIFRRAWTAADEINRIRVKDKDNYRSK
jgi:hypothetical protein